MRPYVSSFGFLRLFGSLVLPLLLGISSQCGLLQAQSQTFPYRLSTRGEVAWLTTGALGFGVARALPHPSVLTSEQRNALTGEGLPFLDRPWANRYSPASGRRSDVLLGSAMGLAVATPLLPAQKSFWSRSWTLGMMCLEANVQTYSLTEISKRTVGRVRPYAYSESTAPETLWTSDDARASFFSGHSSIAACNAAFAATVFSDLYPNSKWKPWVWAGAVALPTITAVERVRAGKHFPTDVLVGLAVGAAVGHVVPRLHRVKAAPIPKPML